MQLYCGIDLHSNNSVVSLIDEDDRVIKEKRLVNDLPTVEAHLAPYQTDIAGVVVESTFNWYWLVDGLVDKGYSVHLANTLAIQQYNGIRGFSPTFCASTFCPRGSYTPRKDGMFAMCFAVDC